MKTVSVAPHTEFHLSTFKAKKYFRSRLLELKTSVACFDPKEKPYQRKAIRAADLTQELIFTKKIYFFPNLFPFRRFGIMGLYKGLEAKLLQTVLTAALMFLVYEKLTAATFTVMGLKSTHKH